HNTQASASAGIDPLPMPYVNTSTNDQVFVSVQDPLTGCISTTVLNITVLDNPVINTDDHYIDACDPDLDGFATFDLTSITNDVLQGLTGVSVTFHETIEDAQTGLNPIPNPTSYNNTVQSQQIVFIRVEDNTTGCASTTPVEIHSNLLLTATNIRDASLCDVDNDNSETFDLASIATGIINDLPDVTITYYETEDDRDNQTNPIDTTVPYEAQSNPQTIYLELSNLTCTEVAEIDLIILPIVEFNSIGDVTVCDEDQDGFTTIDLSSFDSLVTEGNNDFNVFYFETQADADANVNALPNFYTNVSNPQTLFTRIVSIGTGCSSSNSFNVEVLPAPVSTPPSPIVICDDDQDGFFIVNLEAIIPEVVSSTTERAITFHNHQVDADDAVTPITNTTNYSAQTENIYIRIENTVTGCYSTETLSITVNTLPVFTPISNYKICEDNSDGFGDFIFETKDEEILNDQEGKQVLYYETQTDADNRTNPIDKTVAYQNTSSPQTIFVRVENLTDQDCYDTSSFIIEVGTNPLFNIPSDIFTCDDISNDGSVTFDLSTKITEISQGINDNLNITFYTSSTDAELGINTIPLQFTNTVNPQTIYVQIDNGTICNSIASFELNVIQVPEVNQAQPITQCDTDYDGVATFDLTDAELDVLDVRQDDISLAYFESLEDLDTDTNPIATPDQFNNSSNPQTVYLKVTNTISNCYVAIPIELNVNLPPAVNDFQVYDICANDTNSFDLSEINSVIVDVNYNVLFSYFATAADAESNTNALDTNYTYQSTNDTLYARVEFSTTHCYYIYEFNLNVNPLPIANQPQDLEACDDDFDGLLEFDLAQQTNTILGSQNPSDFSVSYHNAIEDANLGNNPLDTTYMAFDGETIYARAENLTTGCYAITDFMIQIHPLPIIDIEDQVICLDNLPLIVSANTNVSGDMYLWSTGETTPEIEITEVGIYSVAVTTGFGCENTHFFSVSESEAANIEFTETIDFSNPNNITITVSGIGEYLYQLDDGEPQMSNIFENVGLGYHTITVIDVNGCSSVTEDVVVIDAPKFMTPNNDGAFDTWHISGVETLPGTIIYIFDRYGKLLKQLGSNTSGWDGTYNDQKMPASDYWFLAKVKRGDESFDVTGHFALRR
ncbi:MAG: T9SS type B sorting domain-containing protein, partial [Bacteroidota bacterium]